MSSLVHIVFRANFRVAVWCYALYRSVMENCFGSSEGFPQDASSETLLWNKFISAGMNIKFEDVKKFRDQSRTLIPMLYPPMGDSWFGCAQKVEKIDELRGSYWITLDNVRGKVMMFMHGGGFVSGHPIGMDTQSIVYGLSDFNKKSRVKCSHVLSVEYRLAEDPDNYHNMDENLCTDNLNDQLEDCYQSFKWLIEEKGIQAKDIVIAGYSAGACHAGMLVLRKLMNSGDSKMWPIQSVALVSAPCDVSNEVVNSDQHIENKVQIIHQGLRDIINRCVPKEEKKKYSLLGTLSEMEKQDSTLYSKLLSSKWIVNFSNNEELTASNRYFVDLLESKANGLNLQDQVIEISENHQMHCYPVGYGVLQIAKQSMNTILDKAFN